MFHQGIIRSLLMLALGIYVCNAHTDITFGNLTDIYVTEGEELDVNVTIVAYNGSDVTIIFQSVNENDFEIINGSTYSLSADMVLPQVYGLKIRGTTFSVSSVVVWVSGVGYDERTRVAEIPVKVLRLANAFFDDVLRYIFFIPISIAYFVMGFTLDMQLVWKCLKRPLAVCIGFSCQFVIMPALAFGIGKMLKLEPYTAMGLFLVGCCPGGKLSNDLSVLVDADIMLSVTMTACSTILALGTMPLNILMYSPLIIDSDFETPYDQVAIQLVAMLTPLFAGVLARVKWPQYEKTFVKILKPVVFLVFLVVTSVSIPFQIYILFSPWEIYVASLLLPLSGGTVGAIMAKLALLEKKQVATIAFETGVQNAIIAYIIMVNAFPQPEADLAGRVPFVGLVLTFFIGVAIISVFNLFKRFVCKGHKEPEDEKEEKGTLDAVDEYSINDGIYRSTSDSIELKDDVQDKTEEEPTGQVNDDLAVEDIKVE